MANLRPPPRYSIAPNAGDGSCRRQRGTGLYSDCAGSPTCCRHPIQHISLQDIEDKTSRSPVASTPVEPTSFWNHPLIAKHSSPSASACLAHSGLHQRITSSLLSCPTSISLTANVLKSLPMSVRSSFIIHRSRRGISMIMVFDC